jgi:prealbumin domain-containing protein
VRVVTGLVAIIAIAVMVGSAAFVVTKEDSPALAVRVEGVPGYVYYSQQYPLTVHYTNEGGAVSGPVELAVQLPETFALAGNIHDPTRHGERLVWQLDGLDAGESGSVQFTVQGTLPDDLTAAVYDLPGYEGHTAFVEGFQMPVTLTAGNATAETLAVADTGIPVATGQVRVLKVCEPDPNAAGDFTIRLLDDRDLEVGAPQSIGCGEGFTFPVVAANGPFTAEETATAAGFVETGNTCLNVAAGPIGDPTICEIENSETGTITIVKDTNPETSGISFDFDSDLGDFDLEDDDSEQFTGLNDTAISFIENPPPGWVLVSIVCNAEDYTVNLETRGVVVDLLPGEDVTCTFTNEPDTGTIIIEKDVNPEPDETNFVFSDNIPGCVVADLDDDPGSTTPNTFTCTDVPAGTYTVTESDPSPYALASINCDDPDDESTVSGSTATIDLDAGETVGCVFVNTPPGSITIRKETDPADDRQFSFTGSLGTFALRDGESMTFDDLEAGDYTVTEVEPSGWSVTRIDCGAAGAPTDVNSVIIQIAADQSITCTFENTADDQPPPATATKPPPVIKPPATGDGGLADGSPAWAGGVASIVAAVSVASVSLLRRRVGSRRG